MLALPATASAAEGDVGFTGPSFVGLNSPPTADKPQSKLWFHDGRWWADMWDVDTSDWHIFWLDRSSNTWVDTEVRIDERASTSADTLWDGEKLYVASHVIRPTSAASAAGQPARLYRYSYSAATKTYALDTGFPTPINDVSSESLTIDKDSTGNLWATWTQVTGTGATATAEVHVNSTTGTDSAWGTPFVVPTTGGVNPSVAPDDISGVVAFRGRIGVLWSNQRDGTVYWSVHNDTAPRDTWAGGVARRGPSEADDHINLKSLQSDQAGRVFAVVKTGLDLRATSTPSDAHIRLLVFQPGTGNWSSTTFGTIADCHTRPQLVLDETNQRVIVVATGPTAAGECTVTGSGTVYMKSTSMSSPAFDAGVGTPILRDALSDNLNNVTTTKQGVTASSGLVVLASNTATERYWHADISLGTVSTVPTSSFTASVTSGQAPLSVTFTDTSTQSPTSWRWDFGDGGTSTERNPAHTFGAGTHTVTLTTSNAAGQGSTATRTVTATAPLVTPGGSSRPLGNFESVTASGPTLTVNGWAFDPDAPAQSLSVHVYVDGRGSAVTASRSRPDVGAAFPAAGPSHGYTWSGTVAPGRHTVCVYAIDANTSSANTALGCRTIDTQLALPRASWDALTATGSTLSVRGWAFDPDSPTATLPVHVYVDGRGSAVSANGSRPDVGAAFAGVGNSHGYTWSGTVAPGRHTVCVYAIDVDLPGRNTALGCRSIDTQLSVPRASWDAVTASGSTLSVRGWAFDPDWPSSAVPVHVYVDGRGSVVSANGSRPDVGAAFPGVGNSHGYTWSGTVAPGRHTVCVYAIDVDLPARNTALGCRSVDTQVTPPRGNWESLTASGSTLSVSGWAFDPDSGTSAGQVHVYVDGQGVAVRANGSRRDVGAAFPGVGDNHGFTYSRTVAAGQHTVCVYAIDDQIGGLNTSLGCRSITT